ncbi:hypothetical protein KC325_g119 [Hortaea werneckii]|nr:hypothetical protein KC325_g119 [Hortaea werneckii]
MDTCSPPAPTFKVELASPFRIILMLHNFYGPQDQTKPRVCRPFTDLKQLRYSRYVSSLLHRQWLFHNQKQAETVGTVGRLSNEETTYCATNESSTRKESTTYHVSDAVRWSLAKAFALIEPAKLVMKSRFKIYNSMPSGKMDVAT